MIVTGLQLRRHAKPKTSRWSVLFACLIVSGSLIAQAETGLAQDISAQKIHLPVILDGNRFCDQLTDGLSSKTTCQINTGHPQVLNVISTPAVIRRKKMGGKALTTQLSNSAKAEPKDSDIEFLRTAILDSLTDNPEVQIAKARQDDAKYGVKEARAGFLPHIDATAGSGEEYDYNRGDKNIFTGKRPAGTDSTLLHTEASLVLRQYVWDFGLTTNEYRRAKALFEAASWSTKERVEDISFQIASAYISLLQLQRLVELTKENVAAHEKILRTVQLQKDLGLSTGADVSRVQSALSNIKSRLQDRESELQQGKETYRRLTNRLPGQLVEPPHPDAALPVDADSAAGLIESKAPKLMQAVAQRKSLERQLASNKGNYYPKLALEMQGDYKDDVGGKTGQLAGGKALVTLRYNLFNGGADQAVNNRIRSRIREQSYELRRVEREVEQQVRSDYSALQTAREKVNNINNEVDAAAKVVDLYADQFKTGKRTVFDLLESQNALFNSKSTQVINKYQAVTSGYRVLQGLGMLFGYIADTDTAQKL